MKTSHTGMFLGLFVVFGLLTSNKSFGQLKADLTSNVQSGCPPLVVAFEDASTGSPTNWKWTLGNGTASTIQNPITTYFDPGTYTVKLVITNGSGADSVVKTSYITVYANPQVDLKVSTTSGCFPLDVNFTNASKAGSGTITDYLWDLGDGNVATTTNIAHTYTSSGTFDITLKVTNSFGCFSAITKSDLIQIDDGVNANFSLTSLDVCKTPAAAVFKNSSNGTGTVSYSWNFGDGASSSTASPTHSYSTSGSYNVLLTAQSSSGCSDTATMVLVTNVPASSFIHTVSTCSNQTIHFTNTSVPAPVSCTWDFGDGTTSTDINPDKVYDTTGNYTVKLINVFSSTCSDAITSVINIVSGPAASFTADDSTKCIAPLIVNFTNTTVGAASGYLWDFGDGSTSTAVNPSHTYTKQGTYSVQLTATNSNGCQAVFQKPKYISIQPLKVSGLDNLPDSGCAPLAIQPKVTLNGNNIIKKYTWDFGDGSSSNAQLPVHTYTNEGAFNVKVSVETVDGCIANYILPNAVLTGHKPKASCTFTKDSLCANDSSKFTNTSTNGPITALRWDTGQAVDPVAGQYFYKSLTDTGFRKIVLTAYNNGCADTFSVDSVVYVLPPIAEIDFAMHCDNRQMVDFIDSSKSDITHIWDFGDGQTANTKNPTHVYSSPGNYTVNLYTTNKTCHDIAIVNVFLINEIGTLTLSDSAVCRGKTITADIAGVNLANIKNTKWDFGDGTLVTVNGGTKADHMYSGNGRFKIKAKVTDKNNCQYLYETIDSITVSGPQSNFMSAIPASCANTGVVFTDKSSTDGIHNITNWSWSYGDSSTTNYKSATTFSHIYADTGHYSVRLIVTDSYGCSDTTKKNNYIYITHPSASFIISDSIVCPGKQVLFQNTSTGNNLSYLWNFGDGSKNNLQSPSYTYKKGGSYTPELFVTDINGCRDSIQFKSIQVSQPIAKFLMSDSLSTCPPLQVDFTNKSTDFSSVTWDFGDGSPSSVISPSHIYTYPGVYPVKLIANGYGSCADSITKNITIKGPTGTLTYNPLPGCYSDTTHLFASGKNVAIYTWDFSDGNTVSTAINHFAYTYGPGNYIPKLILQDSLGCKVSIKGVDTIKIYDVKANAAITGSPACNLRAVQFTDLSISGDNIVHHYWFFGDNSTADQKTANHTYNNTGTYNVSLVAETQTGCRDTFNIPAGIQILPAPQISIIGDSSVCAMAGISFSGKAAVKDNSITWSWDFGNGKTATGDTASTVYSNSGTYIVTLTASNAGGCSDTITKKITVHALPKVKAGNDTTVCKNSTYQLNATGAQSYTWSGIGLSCTNCVSPLINPNILSTYIVTGTDAFGCAGSDTVNIDAVSPSALSVSGQDTLCIGETTQLHVSGATTYKWYPSTYLNDDKSTDPVYTAVKDTSITYKVVGFGLQNCFADTGFITVKTFPIPKLNMLQDEIVLNIGSSIRLNAGGSPDITEWRWQPPQGLSSTSVANPVAAPIQTTTYSCIASNGGSCIARDEITIRVTCGNANVFVPNTFSPNGDGMNEIFYPRGSGLFKIKSFRVFNRWGVPVFERFNTTPNNAGQGWNGYYNGKKLMPDVYVYVIEILCENDMVIPLKGTLTLIR